MSVAQKAIKSLDATSLDNDWHFTMEIVEGDEVQTIRNNPHGEKYEKREITTTNGEIPDKQRQAEFHESEVRRIDELGPDSLGYSYLIDAATLKLIQARVRQVEFSFRPKVKAMEDVSDQLRDSLLLNPESGQIEKIEIFNREKLSPAFSVTVDNYQLIFRFQSEQRGNLLNQLKSQAKGSAGFLKNFYKAVYIAFSDYQRAEP